MASVLAEIDAAMARSDAAENADVPTAPATTSADREATHSAVERAAGADTTRGPDLREPRALSEREAAIRPPAFSGGGVGAGPKKRSAEVPRLDAADLARSRLYWFIGVSDTTSKDPGSLTYEPYFGLREKPFSLSSDPRFFFSNSSHGAAFDTLAAGIRRREGVLVLTGEVGTGKTTLCRAVLQSLDQKTFAAFVPDPFLSCEDLLKTLLVDFGVVSVDDIRSGRLRGASRTDLSYPLYDFLASLQPLNAFAVVMIDEAQNLTAELLEEIRILSDLENGQKLLEVFLIGQPELQARLATPSMRQLSQRVSIRCELSPLAREEVTRYVSHRLTIAGNDGRVQFTDAAFDLVFAASNGIPRVINLVCDRALVGAARSRRTRVEAAHVRWAVNDLKLPVANRPGGLARGIEVPPLDVSSTQLGSQVGDTAPVLRWANLNAGPRGADRGDGVPKAAARTQALDPNFALAPERRRLWPALVGACLVLLTGVVGYWYSIAPVSHRQSDVLAQPAQPRLPLQAPPARSPDLAPDRTDANASAPGATSADVVSPAREGERAGAQDPVPGQTGTGFALQMATFQSPARTAQALQEFRDAGYRAYSVDVSLSDGNRALAVFLGPYTERASAERDLDRARQIPGYGSGRVVQIGASLLPPNVRP